VHELCLSESVVNTALRACPDPARIRTIALEVGALAAVSTSSLEFCMRAVLDQSGMAHTAVEITEIPASLKCRCGCAYETRDVFAPCPQCGGYEREVVGGADLTIKHLEVDDEQD